MHSTTSAQITNAKIVICISTELNLYDQIVPVNVRMHGHEMLHTCNINTLSAMLYVNINRSLSLVIVMCSWIFNNKLSNQLFILINCCMIWNCTRKQIELIDKQTHFPYSIGRPVDVCMCIQSQYSFVMVFMQYELIRNWLPSYTYTNASGIFRTPQRTHTYGLSMGILLLWRLLVPWV